MCLHYRFVYPACKSYLFCATLYCHVASLFLSYFSIYFINGTIFGKNRWIWKEWFDFLHNFETFLILRRTQRDLTINVHWSSYKVPNVLATLQWSLNFLNRFSEDTSNIKLHENPQRGSQIVPRGQTGRQKHGGKDGQTDLTKLKVAFQSFANAWKMHQRIMADILLKKNPIFYTNFFPMRYLKSNISTYMVPTIFLWRDWSGQYHNQWLSVVSDHSQLTIRNRP